MLGFFPPLLSALYTYSEKQADNLRIKTLFACSVSLNGGEYKQIRDTCPRDR